MTRETALKIQFSLMILNTAIFASNLFHHKETIWFIFDYFCMAAVAWIYVDSKEKLEAMSHE